MLSDEIENGQVAFRVPDDRRIILQLQQADIAMVELDGFHLQLRTILGFELKALITAFMGRDVFVETGLVVLEERRMAEGPLAVRTTLSIHLQQTEIHPKLELFLAIFGFESADDHLSGLIIPLVQEVRYVEVHDANMDGGGQQVNGQGASGGIKSVGQIVHCPSPTDGACQDSGSEPVISQAWPGHGLVETGAGELSLTVVCRLIESGQNLNPG